MSFNFIASKNCLKNDYRVFLAKAFLQSLAESTTHKETNTLYLAISKETNWVDETNPPSPSTNLLDEILFRRETIFLKRIRLSNIVHVIPRLDWKAESRYLPYHSQDSSSSVVIVNEDLYGESIYSVYLCVEAPQDSSKLSLITPSYNRLEPSRYIFTSDGYVWVLLYQLSELDMNTLALESWIPLPTDNRISSNSMQAQIKAFSKQRSYPEYDFNNDYFLNIPINGYGSNLEYQLSAYRLLFTCTLLSNEPLLSSNIIYRQLGLWLNPLEKISDSLANKERYLAKDLDLSSGQILYLENKRPIARSPSQSENFKIILEC